MIAAALALGCVVTAGVARSVRLSRPVIVELAAGERTDMDAGGDLSAEAVISECRVVPEEGARDSAAVARRLAAAPTGDRVTGTPLAVTPQADRVEGTPLAATLRRGLMPSLPVVGPLHQVEARLAHWETPVYYIAAQVTDRAGSDLGVALWLSHHSDIVEFAGAGGDEDVDIDESLAEPFARTDYVGLLSVNAVAMQFSAWPPAEPPVPENDDAAQQAEQCARSAAGRGTARPDEQSPPQPGAANPDDAGHRIEPLPPAPIDGRQGAVAVWTGEQVLVWGGGLSAEMGAHPDQVETGIAYEGDDDSGTPIGEVRFSDGAAYDPEARAWRPIAPAPFAGSYGDEAAWTGEVMLVWSAQEERLAAYDPAEDAWRVLAAPPASPGHPAVTMVWTGKEALLWGGMDHQPDLPAFAAAYDPGADTWRSLPEAPVPPRQWHTATWTGEEMVVWGGTTMAHALGEELPGAAYVPATDRWRALPPAPLAGRSGHSAVWSGSEVIFWGGSGGSGGLAYDPARDRWRTTAVSPLVHRHGTKMVWTGEEAVVWGGSSGAVAFDDGAAYDPATDTWALLPGPGLSPRCGQAAAWIGAALFIWGGSPGCDIAPPVADGAVIPRG